MSVLRNDSNIAKIKMGIHVISELFRGHSGGMPMRPELVTYTPIPHDWKEYHHHRGSQWVFQSVL